MRRAARIPSRISVAARRLQRNGLFLPAWNVSEFPFPKMPRLLAAAVQSGVVTRAGRAVPSPVVTPARAARVVCAGGHGK